jgi:hypothetical protein
VRVALSAATLPGTGTGAVEGLKVTSYVSPPRVTLWFTGFCKAATRLELVGVSAPTSVPDQDSVPELPVLVSVRVRIISKVVLKLLVAPDPRVLVMLTPGIEMPAGPGGGTGKCRRGSRRS